MVFFIYRPKYCVKCAIARLLAVITIWILSTSSGISASTSSPGDRAQSDVRQYLNALYARDVDTFVNLTHPKGVEMAGGADSFRLQRNNIARMMKALDLHLDELVFPSPPQFLEGGDGRRFVIVPHLTIVSANNGRRMKTTDFELGVLDPGAISWKYIGGHVEKGIQHLFPDFPSDVKLPPRTAAGRQPQ